MTNQEAIDILNGRYADLKGQFVQALECVQNEESALKIAISALGKQIPKIPDIWGDGYDDKGNMIYDMYTCPNCGENYEIDYDHYDYCPKCGQRIDKSDKAFE